MAEFGRTKIMTTGGKQSGGFTIIETMIVLAVSAALAASMIVLINGRQTKTQFMVAANGLKQQMEQIINETSNGYYPNTDDFSCNPIPIPLSIQPGTNKQGTNTGCIFLGKAVEFGVGSTSSSNNKEESFIVYPLIAKSSYNNGTAVVDVDSFANAGPIALAPDTNNNTQGINHSVEYRTQNGLYLVQARYSLVAGGYSIPPKPYAIFALADQLGQYKLNSQNQLDSSVQKLDLYDYDLSSFVPCGPSAPVDSAHVVDCINHNIDTGSLDASLVKSLELCFSNGTKQRAVLTINGQGQLSVTLKILGNGLCS